MSEPGKPVVGLYAWIADDPDGGQGVAAAHIRGIGWMPLVGADMARMRSLRPHAVIVREKTGLPVRLVRFGRSEVLEELP